MIKSDLKYDNYLKEKLETPNHQSSNILRNSKIPSKVPKTMQLKCRKMNNITLDDLPVSKIFIFNILNLLLQINPKERKLSNVITKKDVCEVEPYTERVFNT